MQYNPKIHNRQSIRLKGYDYSKTGMYFITICVQNRMHLLGNIENKKSILNDAGLMVEKWYFELENKYTNIACHECIVMPNHFHCIIEIMESHDIDTHRDAHAGTSLRGRPDVYANTKSNASIFDIIGWFKTMTTNEYIRGVKTKQWQRFEKRFWQLRYWDHIIRNEDDYKRITNYIINNPIKWDEDKFNKPE